MFQNSAPGTAPEINVQKTTVSTDLRGESVDTTNILADLLLLFLVSVCLWFQCKVPYLQDHVIFTAVYLKIVRNSNVCNAINRNRHNPHFHTEGQTLYNAENNMLKLLGERKR